MLKYISTIQLYPLRLRSDENLWEGEVFGGRQLYTPPVEDFSVPVAVIGGGITGALVSHVLVQAGIETAVFEKDKIAGGSTIASTSFLQYETDMTLSGLSQKIGEEGARNAYLYCRKAVELIKNIIAENSLHCNFLEKQSLQFAHNSKMAKMLEEEYGFRKKIFPEIRYLHQKELLSEFHIKSNGAILSTPSGAMNPVAFTRQLIENNYQKGLRVFTQTEIKKISNAPGNKKLLLTKTGIRITCDYLIVCMGYESFRFIKKCSARLFSTWAIASKENEPLPEIFKDTLFWNTASPYLYFTGTEKGRIIAGGGDTLFRPVMFTEGLKARKTALIQKKFRQFIPDYPLEPEISWGGVFGSSPDALPYIGKVNDEDNFLAVLGLGGNGIIFSVLGMEIILSAIWKQHHPLEQYFRPCR